MKRNLFRTRSMYLELSVAISGIAVLLTVTIINLNLTRARGALLEERNHHVSAVTDALAAAAHVAWKTHEPRTLYDVARYAARHSDVCYFQFLDKDGMAVAGAGKGHVGERAGDELSLNALRSEAPYLLQPFTDPQTGTEMLDVSCQVLANGKRVGTLSVGFDVTRYRSKLREMNAQAAGLSFGIIILALFIAFTIARRNMRPLQSLKRNLDKLLAGEDIKKVAVSGVAEIQDLAHSVNAVSHKWSEMYQSLQEAYAELKTLDEMKDGFVSLVGHELRTPLSAIMAYSEVLSYPERLTEDERKEFASIINTESKRLSRLVNDVLDLTKMKGGRLVYRYSRNNINSAVEQAVRTCDGGARSRKIELTFQPGDSLKEMSFDFDRIVQVATNLINNAIKFTPEGGEVSIETRAEKDGGVLLSVSDTGVGIAPEHLEKIFDEFERVGPVDADRPAGTGLGLAICKRLVEDGHGGKIWAHSRGAGKGSSFFVSLPYRREKETRDDTQH